MCFGTPTSQVVAFSYNSQLVENILRPYQEIFEKQEVHRIEYNRPDDEVTSQLVYYLQKWYVSYNRIMVTRESTLM